MPHDYTPALQLRETGQYAQAVDWLNAWLTNHPDDAIAYAHAAHIHTLDKQEELAWAAIHKALQLDPGQAPVQRIHARLLLKKGQVQAALQNAYSAYQQAPQDPENQVMLGAALDLSGDRTNALRLLDAAIATAPRFAEAYCNRALLKMRAGDATAALADAETGLALKPFMTGFWPVAATLRFQLNNLPGAIAALQIACDAEPANISWMITLGEFKRQNGQLEEAVSLLKKATGMAPDNADGWINLGTAYQQADRRSDARLAYARALELEPQRAEICNNLGALAKDDEDWEVALHYFEQALALHPQQVSLLANKAAALSTLGRHREAEQAARQAIELAPTRVEGHLALVALLTSLRRYGDAEPSLRRAIEIAPDRADSHLHLGRILAELGRVAEAEVSFRQAQALQPDLPASYYNLGLLLMEQKRGSEAAACFKEYLRRDLDDAHGCALLLATLEDRSLPARASNAQIDALYVKRAYTWDSGDGYRGAALVADALCVHLPAQAGLHVLDAGCGTGLVASLIRSRVAHMDGVDLSANMLRKAREKGLYDNLYQGDLESFMLGRHATYDAIACAATLIHFGELGPVFGAAATCLKEGGWFVFTLFPNDDESEVGPARISGLARGGCYSHSRSYVRRIATQHGFAVQALDEGVHEHHGDVPVTGLIVTLQKIHS
jgi:predicted TPR repeat methyltransferase